jgi:hypothetical protein
MPLAMSGSPSLLSHSFLSTWSSISFMSGTYSEFLRLFRNTCEIKWALTILYADCEHVWLFGGCYTVNKHCRWTLEEDVLCTLIVGYREKHGRILELVDKMRPPCHWVEFLAPKFDLVRLLELPVLTECVVIAIIFIRAVFSTLKNSLKFLYLLIHSGSMTEK